MSLRSDVSKLVSKITWDTIDGTVNWNIADPPSTLTQGSGDIIPIYLQCIYKQKQKIGLFERRYRQYTDEDTYYWSSMIVLVLLDLSNRVIYESEGPDTSLLNLFNVAKDSASGLSDVIQDLLKD